ncbi:amidase [Paracoccus onubensis]|uniref:amidase n=1 Tax=Paracoccus onubensis TaxID=1675788 RepID=UPI00273028FD|nr:amidase [Paracoccus onubensis]MDP0926570.1 amidase [Paracoccus onubensis]
MNVEQTDITELPLVDLDATAQAEMVRSGAVTPMELLQAAIGRCEALNPALNALASLDADIARQRIEQLAPDGVFHGVPTLLKDLLAYPGLPIGLGSRLMAGHVAPQGSAYTEALDAAGLVMLGKTTTSEFGLLGTTEPLATGATRNPWDVTRSTGGSSGGAAAAVASGMVPVAHASDGGGSIRGPAALCGVFGFKPGRGRTRSTGIPPEAPLAGILSDHCLSRTVRDSANWLRATEAEGLSDPLPETAALESDPPAGLRIGWFARDCFGESPEPEVLEGLERTVALCRSLCHHLVPVEGPRLDRAVAGQAMFDLMAVTAAGMIDMLASGCEDADDLPEPYTRWLADHGRGLPPSRIGAAMQEITVSGAVLTGCLEGVDLLLSPTIPFTAFPLGEFTPGTANAVLRAHFERSAAYTAPASLAGCPAMSVPLHVGASGLPVDSHFTAPVGSDALLFRLAFQLERAAPWLPRLQALSRRLAWRRS